MTSVLNNFFDKILCINLDFREDRWTECCKLFIKHNIKVERLPAIYGQKLNIYTRPEQGTWYPGYVGCGMSHLFALKYAKQLNLRNVLILEDDVDFVEDINEQFKKVIAELPNDWDMLYFGGAHKSPPIKVSEHLWKVTNLLTTHAIAINERYFDTVIESVTNIDTPVDVNYQVLQENYNVYVTNPHLAWQKSGYSTVNEMEVDYSHIVEFPSF